MKIIRKRVLCGEYEYYRLHLSIINPFIVNPFSLKEMNILARFLALDKDSVYGDRFNSFTRKDVCIKENISSAGLCNHLASMVKKGHLTKDRIYKIKDYIFPEDNIQGYQFKIMKDGLEN